MHRYTPPDEHHKVDVHSCEQFNSELMRVMINKKTKKGVPFFEFIKGKTSTKPSHDLLAVPVKRQETTHKDAIDFDFFAII